MAVGAMGMRAPELLSRPYTVNRYEPLREYIVHASHPLPSNQLAPGKTSPVTNARATCKRDHDDEPIFGWHDSCVIRENK
jgi:hypothetical protein